MDSLFIATVGGLIAAVLYVAFSFWWAEKTASTEHLEL